MQPFRVMPAGRPQDYVTYGFSAHRRRIRCEQVSTACDSPGCPERHCGPWAHGWVTRVPPLSEAARYIQTGSKRTYMDTGNVDGTTSFTFPPGQQCFTAHYVNFERDPTYFRRAGDWRSSGKGYVLSGQQWLDNFIETTEATRKIIERG